MLWRRRREQRRVRGLGAVTTYAHPVYAPDGDGPDEPFRPFRMVEARELVADAAPGVVDATEPRQLGDLAAVLDRARASHRAVEEAGAGGAAAPARRRRPAERYRRTRPR